jgi:hypothetical protein
MEPVIDQLQQLEVLVKPFPIVLNQLENYIGFPHANGDSVCEQLTTIGFPNCSYFDGEVQISLEQPQVTIFLDQDDFGVQVRPQDFYKYLFILTPIDKKFYAYDYDRKLTFIDFKPVNDNFFFENVWEYYLFLDFLKQQDYQENRPFYFVDHYDDARRQFVFISPKKEGKLIVSFDKTKPIFPPEKSLKPIFDRFRATFGEQNKHLPKFIKYELFSVLAKIDRADRMLILIDRLPDMMNTAEQNFEVYLHDLSLDKLKSEYQKSQEDYFTKLRELLGKLITQIFAFPISITATAFATFKVPSSDQPSLTNVLLYLIIFSFLIFTGFTAYLLRIQRIDVDELHINFLADFEKLTKNKFFENPINEKEKKLFETARTKVEAQFERVLWAGRLYFIIQTLFNSLFITAILFQITKQIELALGAGILSIFALGSVYFYVGRRVK